MQNLARKFWISGALLGDSVITAAAAEGQEVEVEELVVDDGIASIVARCRPPMMR
jgi:hypothetical protein